MDKMKKGVRRGGSLSWSEREAMVRDYQTGRYTKQELWQRYTGQKKEHGQLLEWMRALGHLTDRPPRAAYGNVVYLGLQAPTALAKEKNENGKDPEELERRIKELERQLEDAQLKAEGYELMVKIAEEQYRIPIRKKRGTK
jgi:transposase